MQLVNGGSLDGLWDLVMTLSDCCDCACFYSLCENMLVWQDVQRFKDI